MNTLITCEHAGHVVPDEYAHLFAGRQAVLTSHRGWDPGAWEAARFMAGRLKAPVYGCLTTRLLIEVNRSLHHEQLFSEFSRVLDDETRHGLVASIYAPYRQAVEECINVTQGPVRHLSMHSFTPRLAGEERRVDIGLLFDPARRNEQTFCDRYLHSLAKTFPELTIRFNEPYKGIDDGFTTYLRTKFPDEKYSGIEIELNQKFVNTAAWQGLKEGLVSALQL